MRNLGEDSSKRLQLWGKYEMKKEKASSKRHYFDRFELDLDNDGPNVHLDFLYDEKTDKEPIKSHKTNPNFAFSNINKSGSFPLEQNSKGKGRATRKGKSRPCGEGKGKPKGKAHWGCPV